MTHCDVCSNEVEAGELVATEGGRVCPDCKLNADFGGSWVEPRLLMILGGIGAVLPFLVSVSSSTVETQLEHFSHELTKVQVTFGPTAPAPDATSFVDWVAVVGGPLALVCGIGLAAGNVRADSVDPLQVAAATVMILTGLFHTTYGLGLLM